MALLTSGTYKMWYRGKGDDAFGRIFYATSPDGLTWTKYDNSYPPDSDSTSTNGRIPIGSFGMGDMSRVASPVVIKDGATYKMWYVGDDGSVEAYRRIFYATQNVGIAGSALASGWHHIVGTKGSSGALNLYVDGAAVTSGSTSVTGISNGSTLLMGGLFNGKIDEAVIYNRELTPVEVTSRYNAGGP